MPLAGPRVDPVDVCCVSIGDEPQLDGAAVAVKEKPFQKGTIIGGAIFGMGWAMTGACPGPIYAQMGSGEYMALFTFLGACGGAYLYAFLRPRLPH